MLIGIDQTMINPTIGIDMITDIKEKAITNANITQTATIINLS